VLPRFQRSPARARHTRDQIVGAAHGRFLAEGYAATTVTAIAAAVRVSVETICKSFGVAWLKKALRGFRVSGRSRPG